MKEIRYDHKAHYTYRGKFIPASFDIYFKEGRSEIAWYNSRLNTLFFKTDYIAHKTKSDFLKSYPERIIGSKFEAAYRSLLLRYANSEISEYC